MRTLVCEILFVKLEWFVTLQNIFVWYICFLANKRVFIMPCYGQRYSVRINLGYHGVAEILAESTQSKRGDVPQ